MSYVWVMQTPLLHLGPDYYWPICWSEFLSVWLTTGLSPHHMLYAVIYMLAEQSKTTPKQANNPAHHRNINTLRAKNNKSKERNEMVATIRIPDKCLSSFLRSLFKLQ